VGLKQRLLAHFDLPPFSQQSHHCGIETRRLHAQHGAPARSNRTIVGLKRSFTQLRPTLSSCSNRTIVGLKLLSSNRKQSVWSSSNRTIVGLKLRSASMGKECKISSNRTIVGLKRKAVSKANGNGLMQQSHHCGIETTLTCPTTWRTFQRSNRTIVGLKLGVN